MLVVAEILIRGRMVQKKQQAAKFVTMQPMKSPPIFEDSTWANETHEVEPTTEMGIPLRQDIRADR